jgi:hypothetical protein
VVNGPLLAELRPLGVKIVTHAHALQKSIERSAPGEIMACSRDPLLKFVWIGGDPVPYMEPGIE